MVKPNTSPSWLDESLYPFSHHYLQTSAGRMHYIDEGSGEILLFVHGTPTWSFLYRDLIKELSNNYRCIAIDHIGFGLSDKPKNFEGSPQAHAQNLHLLINSLGLNDITLIVHDFGGPIGLGAAIDAPEKIRRVVLFNTWLWATQQNKSVQKIDKMVNNWLGRFLYLNLNLSPKFLLKQGFSDKSMLTKNIHQHYTRPFPSKNSRYGLLKIAQALAGSSDWYAQKWDQLDRLENKDWLIIWGMEDSFITPEYLDKWQKRLPRAEVQELGCGHFVPEEKTGAVLLHLQKFMQTEIQR